MIGYSNCIFKVLRLLLLILPKLSEYMKTFKVEDEGKDKNNKLMFFSINDENLLEKYRAIWT